MKKTLLAICLTVASLSLSAQELLDFSQPDPVSATPVRTTKLFRYTMNARMDFSPVFVSPEGGFEISPSLMLGFELRPWRNRHYFSFGVATEYVNSQVFKAHYAIVGDNLSFNEAESGSIGLDRFGYGFPLTYGIDINQRKSLEFTVMPHFWNNLKLTNTYGAGEQSDYLHAQGLNQKDGVSTIGTYYGRFLRGLLSHRKYRHRPEICAFDAFQKGERPLLFHRVLEFHLPALTEDTPFERFSNSLNPNYIQ